MTAINKRLEALERLFAELVQEKLAELQTLILARYPASGDRLALAEFFRFAADGECNPVLARRGAALIELWESATPREEWERLWAFGVELGESAAVLTDPDPLD